MESAAQMFAECGFLSVSLLMKFPRHATTMFQTHQALLTSRPNDSTDSGAPSAGLSKPERKVTLTPDQILTLAGQKYCGGKESVPWTSGRYGIR